jgi:glycosyltransferase involved in cell wall biosynthesis
MGISVHPLSTEQKRRAILIRQHYKQGDDPLLVFAGRLVEEKGIADFLNAVEIIKNDLPGTRVLILGEGQDRKHFEALATKLDITNMVIFKGWVDGKEIAAHLAAADFFVGPSKTAKDGWIEAQGLSFLEAMSTGTPVIATASGGIVETVRNNETGFLVSETNPKQIVEIIKKFHGQDMLLDKVRKNAREMVLKRFSRKVSADNFSQLFDSLVAEQNSSR